MTISYYPNPGEVLLCDFGSHAIPPEMVKRRPVVVVTPRLRRRGELVGIIPLSTTAPEIEEDYHCRLALDQPLPVPFDAGVMWAKCDMYMVVSRQRLDRFKDGRKGGKRTYIAGKVNPDQLKALKAGLLCGLGLASLTVHL